MMNQRNQTLNNEDAINLEIENARNSIAKYREDKDRFAEHDSFPKPIMVYNNPNFKSVVPQTKLRKQTLKKSVISLDYEKSRTLYLNRDPGTSYQDPSRDHYYNPETGAQYGDKLSRARSYQKVNSEGNLRLKSGSGQRPTYSSHVNSDFDELERAKQVLNRGAMELKASLNNNKPHAFNTRFKKFYQSQIKPDLPHPGTIGNIETIGKVAQMAGGMKRQVQFSEESIHGSNGNAPKLKPVKSSKALYKISSKSGLTKLVHQPSSRQEVMQAYRQSYGRAYKSPPRVKKMDAPVHMVNLYPEWHDVTANNRYADGVIAYTESIQNRKESLANPDPDDIDD